MSSQKFQELYRERWIPLIERCFHHFRTDFYDQVSFIPVETTVNEEHLYHQILMTTRSEDLTQYIGELLGSPLELVMAPPQNQLISWSFHLNDLKPDYSFKITTSTRDFWHFRAAHPTILGAHPFHKQWTLRINLLAREQDSPHSEWGQLWITGKLDPKGTWQQSLMIIRDFEIRPEGYPASLEADFDHTLLYELFQKGILKWVDHKARSLSHDRHLCRFTFLETPLEWMGLQLCWMWELVQIN